MSQRQPSCRALSLSVLVALGVGFSGASQAQAAPNFPVTAQQKSTAQQVAQAGVALRRQIGQQDAPLRVADKVG